MIHGVIPPVSLQNRAATRAVYGSGRPTYGCDTARAMLSVTVSPDGSGMVRTRRCRAAYGGTGCYKPPIPKVVCWVLACVVLEQPNGPKPINILHKLRVRLNFT